MPEDDAELISIFADALELTHPAERAAYLDRACEGNAELRERVDALLAAHGRAGQFLEPDSFVISGTDAPETEAEPSASVRMVHVPRHNRRPANSTWHAITTIASRGRPTAPRDSLMARSSPAGTRWSR